MPTVNKKKGKPKAQATKLSHRIASQPLLSGVDIEKGEDELGENSGLPQVWNDCALHSTRVQHRTEQNRTRVQHAENYPVLGAGTQSALGKECETTLDVQCCFGRRYVVGGLEILLPPEKADFDLK